MIMCSSVKLKIMSEKELPSIRDIAKFKKMREEMKGFRIIKNILPFASPFLNLFGINTKQMKEAFKDFDKMEQEFLKLSEIPDKFNDNFTSRGFIIFNFLNPDIAIETIRIAETNIDEAEKYFINHFTPEMVETYLYMMQGVRAFRPRMELAEKALIDYKEERYHACIPVILALTDGLVNELNPQNVGIAADKVDLRAWDCITSHEKGLNALKKIIFKSRTTTTTEEITIPYRHGILHGMDLNYANKTVAAKTWAILFAVRDWAIKAEGKELTEPLPTTKTSWSELLQKIKQHNDWKKSFEQQLENWKPRVIEPGKDIPKNGEIEDFGEGTPEKKLVEFLVYWQKKNYGRMANCIWSFLQDSEKKMAGRVREVYGYHFLKHFELLEIIDEAPSITEIRVLLNYEFNGKCIENEVKFRLIINDSLYKKPLMRDMLNATWGIGNWGHGI
jgi:hypothetical protein